VLVAVFDSVIPLVFNFMTFIDYGLVIGCRIILLMRLCHYPFLMGEAMIAYVVYCQVAGRDGLALILLLVVLLPY
jgi:hypothetical protein